MNKCPYCGEKMELIDIKREGIFWIRDFKHFCKKEEGKIMSEEKITKEEKFMLRKGDLLNPVGVFKALLANKCVLTKKHFTFLIKKKIIYMIKMLN